MILKKCQPQQIKLLKEHQEGSAAFKICQTLQNAGFIAYFAGGCVRDMYLERKPHDLDIATSAHPDEVEKLFEKTILVGKAFGVVRVVLNNTEIEVASFRKDGLYVDGRHPDTVEFSSPEEDAERRDFTVNALFFDPQNECIIDHTNGVKDIETRTIRAVGIADDRFKEDHLRILRAIRFKSQLGFDIEKQTTESIKLNSHLLKDVSSERRYEELTKLIRGNYFFDTLDLIQESKILNSAIADIDWKTAIEEVKAIHKSTAFKSTWEAARDEENDCRLNSFLLLFYALIEKNQTSDLVDYFSSLRPSRYELSKFEKCIEILKNGDNLFNLRTGEQIKLLIELQSALTLELLKLRSQNLSAWNYLETRLNKKKAQHPDGVKCFLTGDDLKAKYKGSEIGKLLNECLIQQLEDKIANRQEALGWLEKQVKSK